MDQLTIWGGVEVVREDGRIRANVTVSAASAGRVGACARTLAWSAARVVRIAIEQGADCLEVEQLEQHEDEQTLSRQAAPHLLPETVEVLQELADEAGVALGVAYRVAMLAGLEHVEGIAAAVRKVHGRDVGPLVELSRKDTRSRLQRELGE